MKETIPGSKAFKNVYFPEQDINKSSNNLILSPKHSNGPVKDFPKHSSGPVKLNYAFVLHLQYPIPAGSIQEPPPLDRATVIHDTAVNMQATSLGLCFLIRAHKFIHAPANSLTCYKDQTKS